MNCPNCGTSNNVDSKFCLRCGQNLTSVQTPDEETLQTTETTFQGESSQLINNTTTQSDNNSQMSGVQPMNSYCSNAPKASFADYLFIILAVILKPFTAFKEELNKFNDFKNSAIMTLIVSSGATLFKLISTMINSVIVKSYDWSSGGYQTTWTWENLKKIEYFEIIGKNFLIYLGIIVAVAAVYYIASLIVKKQTNFSRLLGISAIAVTPMLVCLLVLSPILTLIWDKLAMPITIVGVMYTIVLTYEGMNNEVLVEGNVKYYLNLVCLSILGIAAYYLYMKLFMSTISDDLKDVMGLFG